MDSIEGVVVGEEYIKFFVKNNSGSYFIPIKEINVDRELIISIIETKLNSGESFDLAEAFADKERYDKASEIALENLHTKEYYDKINNTEKPYDYKKIDGIIKPFGNPKTQEECRKMGYTEWEQKEIKKVGTTENPATSLDIEKTQKEIKIESELL